MISITKAFFDAARQKGNKPIVVLYFANAFGMYAWSDQDLSEEMLGLSTVDIIANGDYIADGSILADGGGLAMLGFGKRVVAFGSISETLEVDSLLTGLTSDEAASFSVVLGNVDGFVSRVEATQHLIEGEGVIKIGFPGLSAGDFITRARGRVKRVGLSIGQCTLDFRGA